MKRPPGRVIEREPPEHSRSSEQSTSVNASSFSSTDSGRRLGIPSKRNLLWLIGYLIVTTPQPGLAIPVPSSTSTTLICDHPSSASPSPSVSFPSSLSVPKVYPSANLKEKASSIFGSSPAPSDDDCDRVSCRPSLSSPTSTQMAVPRQSIGHSIRVRTLDAALEQKRVVDLYRSDSSGNWHLNTQWELYGVGPANAAVSTTGPADSTASATGTSVSTTNVSTVSPTRLPPGWGTTSRSEFELPLIVACSVALALVVLVTMFIFIRRRNKRRKKPKKKRPRGKKTDPTEVVYPKPASITSAVESIQTQPTKERPKGKKSLVGTLRSKGTKGFLRLRKRKKSPGSDEDEETEDRDDHAWASRTRPDGGIGGGVAGGEHGPTDRVEPLNEEPRPPRVASYSSLDPLSLTSMSNPASLTDPPTTTTTVSSTVESSTSVEPDTNRTGEPTSVVYHENNPPSTSLVDSNRELTLPETPDSHQPTPPAYRASQVNPSAHRHQHNHHLGDSSPPQSPIHSEQPPIPYSLSAGPGPSDRSNGTPMPATRTGPEGVLASTMGSVPGQASSTIIDASDYPRDEKLANQASAPADLDGAPLTEGHRSDQPEGTAPPGWELENASSALMVSPSTPVPSSSLLFSSSIPPLVGGSGLPHSNTVSAEEGEGISILPAPPKQWGMKTMEDPYISLDTSEVVLGPPDESMDLADYVVDDDDGGGTDDGQGLPSAPFDPQSEPAEEGDHLEQGQEAQAPKKSFEASAPDLPALEEDASAPHLESEA
ncbi:hypothetical protein [Phaffia rhodozyma]|uniref:Uncharacterized protein n=1 Tax=Phaffia rhodozyma TaxID=264483 RepID=A0A0F7SX47_PHARH|nr:hypothetical protein [Phaffia rhodozyma]